MPVYPFQCTACGNAFEVTRKMSEDTSQADCPACGAESRRVFVAPVLGGRASEAPAAPAAPAPDAGHGHGHGHSHGPGGHTH